MKDVSVKKSVEKSKKETPKGSNKRKRDSEQVEKEACNESPKNGHDNDEKENSSGPAKLNAFQFMMNSRHRSIGRNSPGRELSLDDSKDDSSKHNLKARKNRLQNWADQKGAGKRKRDEEIGNTITHKLEKREKRMRKLLNVDCQSDDEVITKKKKKKCAVIESDEDDKEEESEGKVDKKKRQRLSLNKQASGVKLTPKSVKAWKFKIKLCMDENAGNSDLDNENESKSEISVESYGENAGQSENATQGESSKSENATQDEPSHSENATQSESLSAENATPSESSQSDNATQDDASHGETATQSESPRNEDATQSELQDENIAQNADRAADELSHSESEPENVDDTNTVVEIEGNRSKTDDSVVIVEEQSEDSENSTKRVLRTRRSKPKIYDDFVSDSDDEDSPKNGKKAKRGVKMAPVFLKAVPKPKLDPKVIEARREFLMSGVPSSLKKEMEKQQCFEDIEFDVFPSISHIQQKSLDSQLWNLPKPDLKLPEPEIDQIEIKPFSRNLLNLEQGTCVNTEERIFPNKIKNCKRIIKEVKTQNPDYPVYKIFNSIYAKKECRPEKVVESSEKIVPRKRGRPRKIPEKKTETKVVKIDVKQEDTKYALWTEKYKPRSSSDIIGNYGSVSRLKEWLTNWIGPKKIAKSDSESEFIVTDSDSRDSSTKFHGNTVILKGPCGSGKTAAVYAVCSEFGFNVLEVNASSKRTGKRLLQELQEATQSHQVCKRNPLTSFVNEKEKVVKSSTKMCVLLIEDVDLVFDQDEGFTAALSQIITTSKRPIILTTTDEPSCSIQKVLNNYETINFGPLTSILAIWLQIVCLVEGLYVHVKALDELLSCNRGDIRRTLLQLQLYVNSGGQLYKTDDKTRTELEVAIENDLKTDDDNSNLSDLRLDESCESRENVQVHSNCLMGYKSSSWADCRNLEVIWWNFPSILSTPNLAKVRLERSKTDVCERKNEIDKRKLQLISDCYESLAYADVMCGKSQFCDTLGPRWRTRTTDGLGLDESACGYRDCDFDEELALTLLNGRIEAYRKKYGQSEVSFNMAVPESTERRWRSKQFSCADKLQHALLQTDSLARKSIALDYMPYLRTIAKLDFERVSNNAKRGNRFYSHLKSLGVRCADTTYHVASEVFQSWK